MKHYLQILHIILLLTSSISKADDYVWGEEFEEGDVISAETFNQIFNTLQKINRTVKDEDLLGTWSCNAITTRNTDGWINKGSFYQLSNAQVTFTSSGSSSSIESSYSVSTSAPSPFKRISGSFSGVYSLFNNMIFTKIADETDSRIFLVDIKSSTKIDFIFQETSAQSFPAQYASYISCDSAVPVPAAPTAATATNAQTTVNVTWTDQSSDETGFKIYRRLSTETEATQLATDVTASPYVDSSLTEGQTAYYSVAAYNDNGESAKSGVVVATLDSIAPTVVSHVPTANQTDVTGKSISIIFSENITITCPSDATGSSCSNRTETGAVQITRSAGHTHSSYLDLAGFGNLPNHTSVLNLSQETTTSYTDGRVESGWMNNETVTVTVKKEWITDANGNQMEADYTFTFIANADTSD